VSADCSIRASAVTSAAVATSVLPDSRGEEVGASSSTRASTKAGLAAADVASLAIRHVHKHVSESFGPGPIGLRRFPAVRAAQVHGSEDRHYHGRTRAALCAASRDG